MATATTTTKISPPPQNFLNFTLTCSDCKKNQKTFKILLCIFDEHGKCLLTEKEIEEDKWIFSVMISV